MILVPWALVKFDQVKGTVWDGLDETDVTLDKEMVEELFGAKAPV